MSKKRLSPLLMVIGVALVNYAVIAIAVRAGGIVPTASWLAQTGACIAAGVAAVCWGLMLRPAPVSSMVKLFWSKKKGKPCCSPPASQAVSFASQFIDVEAQEDLSALSRLAERIRDNHEVMAMLRSVVQGGAIAIKRESVAEDAADPPAGQEQGVFFL